MNATCWVYIQTERPSNDTTGLWTVGFYDPQGKFISDSDHATVKAAASRVNYLNGGNVGFEA